MTTKAYNRRGLYAALAALAFVLALILMGTGAVSRSFAAIAGSDEKSAAERTGLKIHYFAHDTKNMNFGPDVTMEARGVKQDVLNYVWHLDKDGNPVGNFVDRMAVDPALTAAIAVDVTGRNSAHWPTILGDRAAEFQKVPVGERADALHLAFLKDGEYWKEVLGNLKDFFKHGSATVSELQEYTSSMYMLDRAIDGDKPSVVVRKTRNSGGHFVWFNLKGDGVYGYRLECGYQPVDTETYWQPPAEPPVPDHPDKPTPPPTTRPPETTTIQPKNPDGGPQGQTGGKNPDYGGGKNVKNDTRLSDEPTSPKTYKQPAAPTAKPTTVKSTSAATTPSPKVAESNGQTTKVDNKTYEIVAGNADSKNYQPLDEVQKNPPAVEPALNNKTNSEAIAAPE